MEKVMAFAWANSGKAGLSADMKTSPTIKAAGNGAPAVVIECYALKGNFIDRETQQNGIGWCQGVEYTLDATDRHGVCYEVQMDKKNDYIILGSTNSNAAISKDGICPTLLGIRGEHKDIPILLKQRQNSVIVLNDQGGSVMDVSVEMTATLRAQDHGHPPITCYGVDCRNGVMTEEKTATLQAHPGGGFSYNCTHPVCYGNKEVEPKVTGALCANSHPGSYTGQDAFNNMLPVIKTDKPERKYILRRLTPTECARLQGFPDWWTDGANGSDSNIYRMWGNGIALPCAADVIGRLAKELEAET